MGSVRLCGPQSSSSKKVHPSEGDKAGVQRPSVEGGCVKHPRIIPPGSEFQRKLWSLPAEELGRIFIFIFLSSSAGLEPYGVGRRLIQWVELRGIAGGRRVVTKFTCVFLAVVGSGFEEWGDWTFPQIMFPETLDSQDVKWKKSSLYCLYVCVQACTCVFGVNIKYNWKTEIEDLGNADNGYKR